MNVPVKTFQIEHYGDAAHSTILTALREKMTLARSYRDGANQCVSDIEHAIRILNRIAYNIQEHGTTLHGIQLHEDGHVSFFERKDDMTLHSSDGLHFYFPVEAAKEWLKANPETLPERDYFLLEAIDQWGIVSFDDADCETITFTKGQLVKLIRTAARNMQESETEFVKDAFNAAIEFTFENRSGEGLEFLDDWRHGEWERIARDWPDFDLHTTGDAHAIAIGERVAAEKKAEQEKIRAEEMRDE